MTTLTELLHENSSCSCLQTNHFDGRTTTSVSTGGRTIACFWQFRNFVRCCIVIVFAIKKSNHLKILVTTLGHCSPSSLSTPARFRQHESDRTTKHQFLLSSIYLSELSCPHSLVYLKPARVLFCRCILSA